MEPPHLPHRERPAGCCSSAPPVGLRQVSTGAPAPTAVRYVAPRFRLECKEASVRVVVLGAGFGGLEVAARLSEELGDGVDVILLDKSDHFVFGFSKLDVMFGKTTEAAVRHPYADLAHPGV